MSTESEPDLPCDVCGRTGGARVCASSLGPASFAYCSECLEQGAEPLLMVATAVFVAGGPTKFDPADYGVIRSFADGVYVGLEHILEIYPDLEEGIRDDFFG